MKVLPSIQSPKDLRLIKKELLPTLCEELRSVIIETASKNGGHLGSSLGAVEIITALLLSDSSPRAHTAPTNELRLSHISFTFAHASWQYEG